MRKKLQVFVSSTFLDLIPERQAAVSAILKLGHIPAGMELFTANDKSQWETIKQWIDESDVYMLILGGRYGSIEERSGLSYTELEYNYALSINKPLFAVVINDEAINEKVKVHGLTCTENENPKLLKEFRNKVLSYMSSFFDDIKDIKICVMESLPQIDADRNLTGWVSGKDVTDTKTLVDEISSLKIENNELKSQLKRIPTKSEIDTPVEYPDFKYLKDIFKIKKLNLDGSSSHLNNAEFSLYDLFVKIKGALILGVTNRESDYDEIYSHDVICPELNMYDLVENTAIPNSRYRKFVLTEKGRKFAVFLEKEALLDSK